MNNILIITGTLLSGMVWAQINLQQHILKMSINEWNLGLHIINGYPIFETLRKMHGYEISNQFLSGLFPNGSNGTPATHLMILIII